MHVLYRGGMDGKKTTHRGPKTGQTREDRLKAALKANLARRKQQARVRSSDKPVPDAHPAGQNRGSDQGE